MKRFAFTLQRALDLRAYREREAEIALGRAIRAQTEIENRLKDLAGELAEARSGRFHAGNSASDMRAFELYITRLDAAREDLLKEAAKAEMRTEAARLEYMEASRNRKALDKLRERRLKEYRKEVLAEEVKTLDDISGGEPARDRAAPLAGGTW